MRAKHIEYWICSVCGKHHADKDNAEKCCSTKGDKIYVGHTEGIHTFYKNDNMAEQASDNEDDHTKLVRMEERWKMLRAYISSMYGLDEDEEEDGFIIDSITEYMDSHARKYAYPKEVS